MLSASRHLLMRNAEEEAGLPSLVHYCIASATGYPYALARGGHQALASRVIIHQMAQKGKEGRFLAPSNFLEESFRQNFTSLSQRNQSWTFSEGSASCVRPTFTEPPISLEAVRRKYLLLKLLFGAVEAIATGNGDDAMQELKGSSVQTSGFTEAERVALYRSMAMADLFLGDESRTDVSSFHSSCEENEKLVAAVDSVILHKELTSHLSAQAKDIKMAIQGITSSTSEPPSILKHLRKESSEKRQGMIEEQLTQVKRMTEIRSVNKTFNALLEEVIKAKQRATEKESHPQLKRYLELKFKILQQKARIMELELLCMTYTPDVIKALERISAMLREEEEKMERDFAIAQRELQRYSGLSASFFEIVEEYTRVKKNIANLQWGLDRYK
ncbi:unnamed protein product [Darwinula stevensoni]|uniref:HAUS augmin-like complex subunit 4 n=1 Tax=Darwinula stevensoni TaxID=69355 RepID=A0A7R8X4E9_9CRUS|nr:unnamed protein product [Darwinula stevensoni]CAG0885944.1 unnamed protein product [Darwinula stevensoni]